MEAWEKAARAMDRENSIREARRQQAERDYQQLIEPYRRESDEVNAYDVQDFIDHMLDLDPDD